MYHVVYAGERGVRLVRRSGGFFVVLVSLAALGCLGASALLYNGGVSAWPIPLTMGAAFSGVFALFRGNHHRTTPWQVVFDNLSGHVVLVQRAGGPTAYLPYHAVEGFHLLAEERHPGERADALPRYTVQLQSHDLPELALGVFGAPEPARALLETLKAHVRLNQTSAPVPAPRLPRLFQVRQQGATSELLWKPRQSVAGVLAPFLIVTAYFTFLYYFTRLREWEDAFEKWLLRAMMVGGGIVGVGLIVGQLFADRRTHRISIDARGLAYGRIGKGEDPEVRIEPPVARPLTGFGERVEDAEFKRRLKNEIVPRLALESLSMVERLHVLQFLSRTASGLSGPQPVDAAPPRQTWWQSRPPSTLTSQEGMLGIALLVLSVTPLLLLLSLLVVRDMPNPTFNLFRLAAYLRVGTSVVAGYQLRERPGDRLGLALLVVAMLELVNLLVGDISGYGGLINLALTLVMAVAGIRLVSSGARPPGDARATWRRE